MKIKWDKEQKDWQELEKYSRDGWYIDANLKKNLDRAKENIRKDWDYVFVIDGEEGAGKSVFAMQLANYCSDNQLTINKICITPEEFKKQVREADQYDAIIFDEAFRGLSSRGAMSKTNKTILQMLQEMRQKNLFVFIVLPSIWDLDKHVMLHRTQGLFHIYTGKNKERGFFKFYNEEDLKYMVKNKGKMKYDYPDSSRFAGEFNEYYPISKKKYDEKKHEALTENDEDEDDKKTEKDVLKEKAANWWSKFELTEAQVEKVQKDGWFIPNQAQIAPRFDVSPGTIHNWFKELGITDEHKGGNEEVSDE